MDLCVIVVRWSRSNQPSTDRRKVQDPGRVKRKKDHTNTNSHIPCTVHICHSLMIMIFALSSRKKERKENLIMSIHCPDDFGNRVYKLMPIKAAVMCLSGYIEPSVRYVLFRKY